jgi:hypothetical protein
MNVRRMWLYGIVAVSLAALFTTCTRRDNRDSNAAKQSSLPGKGVGYARSPDELVAERIRTRIEDAGVVTELRIGGEPVYASVALPGFYLRRLYRLAWIDKRGPTRLIDDAAQSEAQGLIGGLGKYPSTASHGPFVHVDVRGRKARW